MKLPVHKGLKESMEIVRDVRAHWPTCPGFRCRRPSCTAARRARREARSILSRLREMREGEKGLGVR